MTVFENDRIFTRYLNFRMLDKDVRVGIIFHAASLNPVLGCGGTVNRGVFPGKSPGIGYFQAQARQLTSSAFEREKSS